MSVIEKKLGPSVVLAGAGTGKTYTIVEKIKYLISNGVSPDKIACITFSNEAANNLVLRVDKIIGSSGRKPVIRTFHGFSADLLRAYGDRIGLSKEFKILDPQQAMVVLHRNLRVQVNNCDRYIHTIGSAKDLGVQLADFQKYLEDNMVHYPGVDMEKRLENLNFELQTMYLKEHGKKKKDLVAEIKRVKGLVDMKKFVAAWSAYEKLKQKGNYQDYSDLNNNSLILLEKNPDLGAAFDYVIVDEFQDTNKVQLDFLVRLAVKGNIMVVGDLNQSIYRFRGAYRENISLFKKSFGVTEKDIFNLDKSYRSSNKILKAAHRLILNNYTNKEECFFVENVYNREGENIQVYELSDAQEEARKIVEIILREQEAGVPLEEICVMFRAHQYGRTIKKVLEQAGVPYFSVAKASLLKQKSVKTAHDYLSILQKLKKKEKGGEQAWWDLVYQLDFSREDLVKIGKCIKEFTKKHVREKEVPEDPSEPPVSVYLFNTLGTLRLSEQGTLSVKLLLEKIKLLLPLLDKPISEILKEVYRFSGMLNEQRTREEREVMLNMNKFYELAKVHEDLYDSDLDNFLYYLDILDSLGIDIEAARLEEKGVRLMTSHATKGLEYRTVIVSNMAQGRFPLERWTGNSLIPTELLPNLKNEIHDLSEEEKEEFIKMYEKHHQLLEERRLAYVSFTRAKEKLILTFAGTYAGKKVSPSAFLQEIGYKNNPDVVFVQDLEKKYQEPEPEFKRASDFSQVLSSGNFDTLLSNMVGEVEKKEKQHPRFSPSALLLFEDCQKQFEYKYVFHMPDRKTVSWEAMRLGSFVHLVLEKGVASCRQSVEDFLALAKEMSLDEEWESVELPEAETLIRVFYERNKGRFNEKSKTEQYLPMQLAGMQFMGFADRIDFTPGGVEIVDYKTGKSAIGPKDRNWQLGFYALAAQEKFGKVKKVVLDMLRQDKPLEFEFDDKGNATCVSSDRMHGFNMYEVEQEIIMAAHKIQEAYKKGFKACSIEKNCEFCNEYVYNL